MYYIQIYVWNQHPNHLNAASTNRVVSAEVQPVGVRWASLTVKMAVEQNQKIGTPLVFQ